MSFVEQLTSKIESIRSNLQNVIESLRPGIISGEAKPPIPNIRILETLREEGYRPGIVIENALNRIKEFREKLGFIPKKEVKPVPKTPEIAQSEAGIVHVVGEEEPTFVYSEPEESIVSGETAESQAEEVMETSGTPETRPKRSFFY